MWRRRRRRSARPGVAAAANEHWNSEEDCCVPAPPAAAASARCSRSPTADAMAATSGGPTDSTVCAVSSMRRDVRERVNSVMGGRMTQLGRIDDVVTSDHSFLWEIPAERIRGGSYREYTQRAIPVVPHHDSLGRFTHFGMRTAAVPHQ